MSRADIDLFINGKDKTSDAFKSVNAGLKDMGEHVNRTTSKVSAFTVAIGTVMGNAITGSLSKLTTIASSLISTGIEFDSLRQQSEIAFTTMLGSGEKARVFLDDLQQFAASTPFEFPDLISASQRLLAMGFAADKVRPTLTAVGDAVAGLGGSSAMVDRVTTALGQMQAKGKASGEEMMQLTEAGIPAWEFLAKKIGVDIPTAMDMVSKGSINAEMAIGALVDGMNSKFGGLMEQQSRSWAGLWSTIRDTYTQVSGKVLLPFFNLASDGLRRLVDFTNTPFFNAWVKELAEGAERAADWIAALVQQIEYLFADMDTGLTFTGRLKVALHDLFGETLGGALSNIVDLAGDVLLVFRSLFQDVAVFEDENPLVAWLVNLGSMIRATVATINHLFQFDELVSSVEFGLSTSTAAVVDYLVDFVLRIYDIGKSVYDAVMSVVGVFVHLGQYGELMSTSEFGLNGAMVKIADNVVAAILTIYDAVTSIVSVFVHLGRYGELMSTSEFGLNGAMAIIADNVVSAFLIIYDAAVSVYEIFRLLITGDFRGGIFGLQEDDPIIGALFGIRTAMIAVGNFVINELPHWRTRWKDWAAAAWEWIVDAARKVPEKLGEWWTALTAWYDQHKEPWGAKIAEWATIAWQWIVDAATALPEKIGQWWTALTAWYDQHKEQFATRLGEWAVIAWQWIVDAAGVVGAYLSDWYIALSTWLTQNLPVLQTKLTEWSNAFGEMIANAAKRITVDGKPILDWFQEQFPKTTDTSIKAMKEVTAAWEAMWKAIKGYQEQQETDTQSWMERLVDFFERHGETLKGIIDRDWALMVEIISNAIELAIGFVTASVLAFQGDWGGWWEQVKVNYQTIWDTITAITQTIWMGLKDIFNIGMEEISLAIPAHVQNWIDKLTSPWVTIYDIFSNVGRNAVQGLIDGIGNMIGQAQAKITELGNLAVQAMGISLESNSPSKKFMRLGEYSGEGYIIGLERKLSNLGATMNDLARGGMGTGMTSSTNSVEINVHVQSTGDAVRDIRNQIELYRMAYGGYA